VHLFDTRAGIRGREIEVFFIKKIRNETRFPCVAALKRRIIKDIARARQILGK
jgi:riboflavin kinase/FMN adenylyltransferase